MHVTREGKIHTCTVRCGKCPFLAVSSHFSGASAAYVANACPFSRAQQKQYQSEVPLIITIFRASSSQKEQSLLPAVRPLDDDDSTVTATKQKSSLALPALENADSASGEPTPDFAFNIPVPGMYENKKF